MQNDPSTESGFFSLEPEHLEDLQRRSERSAATAAVVRCREYAAQAAKDHRGAYLLPGLRLLVQQHHDLRLAIESAKAVAPGKGRPPAWRALLTEIDAEAAAGVTLLCAISACVQSPTHAAIVRDLADRIGKDLMPANATGDARWFRRGRIAIGERLLDILQQQAQGTNAEGDYAIFQAGREWTKKSGFMPAVVMAQEAHAQFTAWVEAGHQFAPTRNPMYVRPGGYRFGERPYRRNRTEVVPNASPRQNDLASEVDLTAYARALDWLGSVEMRLDEFVVNTLLSAHKSGDDFLTPSGKLLARFKAPRALSAKARRYLVRIAKPGEKGEPEQSDEKKKLSRMARWKIRKADATRAEWWRTHSAVNAINQLRDESGSLTTPFYLPHHLDFRGRIYPLPQTLHHQREDLVRSLFCFAEDLKMSNRGLWWLCVEAAGAHGTCGTSFDARFAWAQEHLDDIIQCATRPAESVSIWGAAEEPWRFLAACGAIYRAGSAGDAGGHGTPVRLDATCSGLQILCALARDHHGAPHANLTGSERGDLYGHVAALAFREIESDICAGGIAAEIGKQLNRRMVKSIVMTTPYNITAQGAIGKMRAELWNLYGQGEIGEGMSEADITPIIREWSAKLASVVQAAIRAACPYAESLREWIGECGEIILTTGRPIEWANPAGWKVSQTKAKYVEQRTETIRTSNNGRMVLALPLDGTEPIKRTKQLSGLVANIVHSLDSAHVACVVNACRLARIPVATIHDCFMAPAVCVDDLNRIVREQFVMMHTRWTIDTLRDEWQQRYGVSLPPVPQRGLLNVESVLSAEYFIC